MSAIDLIQQQLGPNEIRQLSSEIGADPAQTETAVQAALPMLLGGMASSAQQPGGAQNVATAMQQHAGGMLGGLGSILGGLAGGGGGGGILGQILGHQQPAVQDGVQQASGLDADRTKKLLMLLAPIVLAALARRHAQPSANPGGGTGVGTDLNGDGIPDALQQEAREAQAHTARTAPHIGGIVGKILDAATRH